MIRFFFSYTGIVDGQKLSGVDNRSRERYNFKLPYTTADLENIPREGGISG
jgi:hypothetical protein